LVELAACLFLFGAFAEPDRFFIFFRTFPHFSARRAILPSDRELEGAGRFPLAAPKAENRKGKTENRKQK
jgi:hypothetical protein